MTSITRNLQAMEKAAAPSKNQALMRLAAVVLIPAMLYLGRHPLLLAIGDFLIIQDELRPADTIHVISGPDERPEYGIELYLQGYGQRLFFTGSGYQAEDAYWLSLRRGVPESAVTADSSAVTSTYSEAVRLQAFIAQSRAPIRSVILVSDPYHMRRALWTYQRVVGPGVTFQAAPLAFELSRYRREWWRHPTSLDMVSSEYLKMAYYRVTYALAWGTTKEWLMSLDKY